MSLRVGRGKFGDGKALAARLKHRVSIEQRARNDDAIGGSAVSWQLLDMVWAELRSRSGNERVFAGKLQASASHEMTMRYRSDISTDMRVRYEGRLFNIRRVENVDSADVLLELQLEEGVAQ